jgi:hypothetical protein
MAKSQNIVNMEKLTSLKEEEVVLPNCHLSEEEGL